MGRNMSRIKSNAIIGIKHKKIFYASLMIWPLIISLVILLGFGYFFEFEINAANNDFKYEGTNIEMPLIDRLRAGGIVTSMKALVYYCPGLVTLIGWVIFQKKHNVKLNVKTVFRVYIAFEIIVLFAYSLFSFVHYTLSLNYFLKFQNPFSQVELAMFGVGLLTAKLMKKDFLEIEDKKIFRILFKEDNK